jgi:hypothetical protein
MLRLTYTLVAGTMLWIVGGCHRFDDPPLPETPSGLAAYGVTSAAPAAASESAPMEPIVVVAQPHSPIITAADVVDDGELGVSLDLRYDPGNEITIRGPVLGKRFLRLEGGHTAEIVELMPGENFIDVMLGTSEFFHANNINVGIPDPIMVRGSVVRLEGRDMLLARELTWRGTTYQVRDERGWPLWRTSERQVAASANTPAWWPW